VVTDLTTVDLATKHVANVKRLAVALTYFTEENSARGLRGASQLTFSEVHAEVGYMKIIQMCEQR
jgi:hypothetical protein